MVNAMFDSFTKTINSLKKLNNEIISKKTTFKVNVAILSTLLLEFLYVFIVILYLFIYYYYMFSIAKSFQNTFTAYEYT